MCDPIYFWSCTVPAHLSLKRYLELVVGLEPTTEWLQITCATYYAIPAYSKSFFPTPSQGNFAAVLQTKMRFSKNNTIITYLFFAVNTFLKVFLIFFNLSVSTHSLPLYSLARIRFFQSHPIRHKVFRIIPKHLQVHFFQAFRVFR